MVNEGRIIQGNQSDQRLCAASSMLWAIPEFGVFQANRFHRLIKALAIFCFIDGIGIGANHFYAVLFQYAVFGQVQCAVQRSLATHGGQQMRRAFPAQ